MIGFIFSAILCLLLNTSYVLGACQPGYKSCEIETWSKWFDCDATCGGGYSRRERYLCCEDNVQPHTRDNCITHCKYTLKWWDQHAVERKTCAQKCSYGTYDPRQNNCKCSPGFTGKCCDKGRRRN